MQLSRPGWARLRRAGDGGWRVAGTVVAVLATLVAGLALLLHAVPTTWQPAVVLASGSHYPMWASVPALAAGLLVRRWGTAAVAAVLSALVLVVQVPTWVGATPPAHGVRIVVMQANLRLGSADARSVVDRVRADRVTLLTTEELTVPEQARLAAAGLSEQLPYHYTVPSAPGAGNGIGLWSRYPISHRRLLPGFELKVITVRVAQPGRPFVAAAVHLLPPWPQRPGGWAAELARLKTVLRAVPAGEPVIASGDYNSTVDHAQFRRLLSDGYADAAAQAGAGYPRTYPADRWTGPLIAIDHVLTRDAVATSLQTVALPGSDHRGLVAQVLLRTDG